MANTAAIVTQIEGQAWLRNKDGSLEVLRVGMRLPPNAEIVTAAGSRVFLQGDESGMLQISENQQLTLTDDLLQATEASEAAIAQPADQDVDALITALNAGQDPLEELEPTEAVLSGGEGAGSTYVRLASILESTVPLDLAYPRGLTPQTPPPEFSAGGIDPTSESSGEVVNLPPVTQGELVARTNEDSDFISDLDVAVYFQDPENGALTYSATNLPLGLSIDPVTGRISGTLDGSASQGGINGVYNVIITATDPQGASTSLTFQWTITNPAPDALNDEGFIQENALLTVSKVNGLLSNDVDRDGDMLRILEITNAAGTAVTAGQALQGTNGGILKVEADGSYTFSQGTDFDYLPAGQTTQVVFTYSISDGDGGLDTAQLIITITGTNDLPVAVAETRSIKEPGIAKDSTGQWQEVPEPAALTGNVLDKASDVDQGDKAQLTVTGVRTGELDGTNTSLPALGSQALEGVYGSLTLDAQGNYVYTLRTGSDSVESLTQGQIVYDVFAYEITDPQGGKDWAEIRIQVVGTNDAPIAQAEVNGVQESGVLQGGNTPFNPSNEAKGNVLVGKATDVDAGETATLKVQSLSLIDSTTSAVLQTVSAGAVITTAYGQLQLFEDGSYVYTLNNSADVVNQLAQGDKHYETFQYVIVDAQGAPATATLTITVTGTNDRPVIDLGQQSKWDTDVIESNNGVGGDDTASGVLVASDVDLGAQQNWKWVQAGEPVEETTISGTYGSIEIKDGKWIYTLDQNALTTQALTHKSDPVYEIFKVRVIDEFGAWDEQEIRVKVTGTNDLPIAKDDSIVVKEETTVSGNLITGAKLGAYETGTIINADINADGGQLTIIGLNINGVNYPADGSAIDILGVNGHLLGTLFVSSSGDYLFEAAHNYSGKLPEIRYTVKEPDAEGGNTASATLSVQIVPLADKPVLNGEKNIIIDEDTSTALSTENASKSLGLTAPVVTDAFDFNGEDVDGDYPERLGVITLTITGGAFDSQNIGYLNIADFPKIALDQPENIVKVVISNGDKHISNIDMNGVLVLTKEQYENITLTPAEHRGENITLKVDVTSYEVDELGVPLLDILGEKAETKTEIDVLAVTDPVDLQWKDVAISDQQVHTLSAKEDVDLDLKAYINSVFNDTDGSEKRWFTITNNSNQDIFVNGKLLSKGETSDEVDFDVKALNVKGPHDFSGDIEGLVLTLYAQDNDLDSPSHNPAIVKDELSFNLNVEPIVDPLYLRTKPMTEDISANLWETLGVTMGDNADGSQIISTFDLHELPAGWRLVDFSGQDKVAVNGKYSFVDGPGVDYLGLKAILEEFTIIPPAQSSKDIKVYLDWNVIDTSSNGLAIDPRWMPDDEHTLVVKPSAEYIPDSGNQNPENLNDDLTMTKGKVYSAGTAVSEDNWFKINSDGFNFKDGWSNPDESGITNNDGDYVREKTFALLTPKLIGGNELDSAIGSTFRYVGDDGQWVEVRFGGDPVQIEVKYLDTLEFIAPYNVSGHFEIDVRARTIDYGEDAADNEVAAHIISGYAKLEGIFVKPITDGIDALQVTNASGLEDTPIALNINPSSVDRSETFNVKIGDIPVNAQIIYDGKILTPDSVNEEGFEVTVDAGGKWTLVIIGFDSNKSLEVMPPPQSNASFELQVSAQTVDALPSGGDPSTSDFEKQQPLRVNIQGVADEVEIITKSVLLTEEQLDNGSAHVLLGDAIVRFVRVDDDGSEVLSFRITGLAEGFKLLGAQPIKTGTGEERVWLVKSEDELKALKIIAPEHYSGTLTINVIPVTTENDNDWHMSQAQTLSFVVNPSPESSVITRSVIEEDAPIGETSKVNFDILNNFGDTNESLKTIWIKAEDIQGKGFELFVGDEPLLSYGTLVDGYYKLTGVELDQITARATEVHFAHNQETETFKFNFKYEVADQSSDGSIPDAVKISEGVYDLSIKPVTDILRAELDGFSSNSQDITAIGNLVSVKSVGNFGIQFNLQSEDTDGSEHLIQLEVAGVPDGLIIEGISINNSAPIGTVSFVGNNTWVVSIPPGQISSIGSNNLDALQAELTFRAGNFLGIHNNHPITITSISQDTGADNVSSAPITWWMDSSLPGVGTPKAVELTWQENPSFSQEEDDSFTMDQAFIATMQVDHPSPAVHFTLKLTLPEGASVTYNGLELTPTSIGGADAWIVTGFGTEADINAMLQNLEVTPPAHVNSNLGGLIYSASLTAHHPDTGSQAQKDLGGAIDLTPVTDETGITIDLTKAGTVDAPEEGTPVDVRIQIGNGVDGGSELGQYLYVQLDEPFNVPGRLLDMQGNEVPKVALAAGNPMGLPPGDYYRLELVERNLALGDSESIVLRYEPAAEHTYSSGQLAVNAWIERRELNSNDPMQKVSQTASAHLKEVSNGYDVDVPPELQMTENPGNTANSSANRIELDIGGTGLRDSAEAVFLAMLKNVPKGFVVFFGQDASTAKIAPNAGNEDGEGASWLIEVDPATGKLPPYIAIQPPAHWSGRVEDIALSIVSGEPGGEGLIDNATFNLVVEAKANGVQTPVQASAAFGQEGDIAKFNLNISMEDVKAAVPDSGNPSAHLDSSTETLHLRFSGLGAHAAFYVGSELLAFNGADRGFSFDEATGQYTVYGLSQADSEQLGVLQSRQAAQSTITFEAWTQESINGDKSPEVSGSFVLDIRGQSTPTPGSNELMFDGLNPIDAGAGIDTVWMRFGEDLDFSNGDDNLFKNIEVIDLTRDGFDHDLLNLSAEAVQKMTDANNKLTIKANAGDLISLVEDDWVAGTELPNDWVYTSTVAGAPVQLVISKAATLEMVGSAQARSALMAADVLEDEEASADALLGQPDARVAALSAAQSGGAHPAASEGADLEIQQKLAQQLLDQGRLGSDLNA